jgi:hypothetical protein
LESFRKIFDKRRKKKFSRNERLGHSRTAPAELEATVEVREASMPPVRPVHDTPVYNFCSITPASPPETPAGPVVTPASSLAREIHIIRR